MCAGLHAYAKFLVRLVLGFVFRLTSVNDSTGTTCFCYIHHADTIWRVSSCISLVNYFSRESISRHFVRPFVRPIYHPAPPSKRISKIFMCTDIGLRARPNRSHRTRECRGSINIGPPGQIAFESVEKGEEEKRKKNLSFWKRTPGAFHTIAYRCESLRCKFPNFAEIASPWKINRA